MPVLETSGDRLLSITGRRTWLAKPSVPFSAYMAGGAIALAGEGNTISYGQLYRTQPWVASSVNKLARQIARLPLKVYRLDSQGNRERVRDGALPDLLKRPWDRGSNQDLKQALAFPAVLHGNSLLAKSRDNRGGPPTSFIPLDWRFASPRTDEAGKVLFWETTQTGESRFLAPEDVIHTAWWAPDGDIGVSPLQQLGITIRLEDSAQRYSTGSFDNAARPSGALITPPDVDLKPEEKADLRKEIQDTHGGVNNAFKVMLLTGGMDWKPFSQTAKEAELIEARKLNREEVAAVFDIPPPMIGILDNATYSNITEQHLMLYKTILGPWLDLIEHKLQAQLIDPEPAYEGLFCEFDLNEVLKGDVEKRIPAITKGIETGLYTLNDGRKLENLPRYDIPEADVPLSPVNNLLTAIGTTPAPTAAPMLASHIARARDRVLSKAGAGVESPFDAERFKRELEADLEMDEAETLAASWADVLEKGVAEAGGDKDRLRSFFDSLT